MMAFKKGELVDLVITDMAFGGKGLAKPDGFAIFVDQAVPMDRVRARIVKKKKTFAEARIVELQEASPLRIDPPCPYSGFCGGCKWQFLDYEKQLVYKRRHVVDSLAHIGGIQEVTVHAAIPSPLRFGYRNKMEFTCSDRRWLLPSEMEAQRDAIDTGFALGLHVPGAYYKVFDTAACLLQPSLGNRILDDIRTYIRSSGIPVYGLRIHEGFWRFVMLRHSVEKDQWMVNLITASENQKTLSPLADMLIKTYPQVVSVMNNITARKASVAVGEYEVCLAGRSTLCDTIGDFTFDISANSFFQTNTLGAGKLYEVVKKYADLAGNETIVDLYCGAGTISIFLSASAGTVIGFEIMESAVADAVNNCKRNGVSNCRFIHGDIKDSFSRLTSRPDVMIIDPPRAGMHKDVVKQVLDMAPDKVVYVSCNPATLSRDLLMLKDRYRAMEVQPVDMFPHTFHIESVARLEKIA